MSFGWCFFSPSSLFYCLSLSPFVPWGAFFLLFPFAALQDSTGLSLSAHEDQLLGSTTRELDQLLGDRLVDRSYCCYCCYYDNVDKLELLLLLLLLLLPH